MKPQKRTRRTLSTRASQELHKEAKRWAPFGVQGDARYFQPYPLYISKANGAHIYDVDGNRYIDCWAAAGPIILSHTYEPIVSGIHEVMESRGTLYCLPHPAEVELARRLCQLIPSAEKAVFGCGGSDATFFAVRAARAFTGRSKLVKFEGGYHGWHDPLLVNVRPAAPDESAYDSHSVIRPFAASSGLPHSTIEDIYVLPYNDREAVERLMSEKGGEIAAVIVEPILHSQGCILPIPGFLEDLRQACSDQGTVLIFDEIITGFRHGLGGVQQIFNVVPDLTTLGKSMANGFPISALVGKQEIMSVLTPEGDAYYSGTYMGHPICVTAALKTIEALEDGTVHKHIFGLGEEFASAVNVLGKELAIPVRCQQFGSIWSIYFTIAEVRNYRDVARLDFPRGSADVALRRHLLSRGVYHHPPSTRGYFFGAHTVDDLGKVLEAVEEFLRMNRSTLKADIEGGVGR